MLLALAHGLAYAFVVPLWEAPDEPMLFEYAALMAELGRAPAAADRSPELEARLLDSLGRAGFWARRAGGEPGAPPASLAEAAARYNMPRQVGGDPPLAFVHQAAALRVVPGWTIERQALLLRALNAALLPLAVLCSCLAARRLLLPAGLPPAASLLAAAIVALQPMAAFGGAAVGDDALANALGAGLCLLLVRAVTPRPSGPWLLALAAGAVLALFVKRTALPYALLAAALGALWLVRGAPAIWRAPRRAALVALGLGGAGALALAWAAPQLDRSAAAGWLDARSEAPARRAETTAGPALLLRAGEEAVQPLPSRGAAALRNDALSFGARVWSDGPASGRLVLYTGERRQELPFAVERAGAVELRGFVPASAPDVRLGIVADTGWFYAAAIWGRGVGLPGEIVANGRLAAPALRPGAPLEAAARYLRLDDLAWALRSGRPAQGIEPGPWALTLFASFWGQFGWLDLPVVRGSFWEPALALACAAGLAGAAFALARRPALRPGLLALLALQGLAALVILARSLADPAAPPQGRYLLPALAPLAITLTVGYAALAPARRPGPWLAAWAAFWLTFAAAALAGVAGHYR